MATSKVGRREASAQSEATPQNAKIAALQKRGQELTAVLGETVAILMRDPRFRHMTLNDLEWAVVPALLTNQFMMMRGMVRPKFEGEDGTAGGLTVPVGLALWASVSDAVGEKLAKQRADGVGYRLSPNEWNSGEKRWLLVLVGPEQTLPVLEAKVVASVFESGPYAVHTYAARRGAPEAKTDAMETETSTGNSPKPMNLPTP